ncbi:MAG: hypothetical protein ACRDQA_03535, partial [Nocardioidaceae bacterium]
RYTNPVNAWQHEVAYGWYDQGGLLPPGASVVYNGTGQSETVLTSRQLDALTSGRSGGALVDNLTLNNYESGTTAPELLHEMDFELRRIRQGSRG